MLWQEWQEGTGCLGLPGAGLGGWDLDIHHAYDPVNRVLYLGSGEQNSSFDDRRQSSRRWRARVIARTGSAMAGRPPRRISIDPWASRSGRKVASTSRIPTIPASAA